MADVKYADAHASDKTHDLRSVAKPYGLLILKKNNIFDPMKIVLNTPVSSQVFCYFFGW